MNYIQDITVDELKSIHGGFPWAGLNAVLVIIHQEGPDFVQGWKDYHKGAFTPPRPPR